MGSSLAETINKLHIEELFVDNCHITDEELLQFQNELTEDKVDFHYIFFLLI